MFQQLRESSLKRLCQLSGTYKVQRFNIEFPLGSARRIRKDGETESKASFKLKTGETYVVSTTASFDMHQQSKGMILEGQINPAIASKAQVTLSHKYVTPELEGTISPVLVITPIEDFNIVEVPWGVRWFSELVAYPSWNQ